MKWTSKRFSNYKRWQFDISHSGYPVSIVVRHYFLRRNLIEISWSTPLMKSAKWAIDSVLYDRGAKGHKPRKKMFKRLRQSLSYGLNVKGRTAVDRLMEANGQRIPHKKTRLSAKA